jgi:hypothetical protein
MMSYSKKIPVTNQMTNGSNTVNANVSIIAVL